MSELITETLRNELMRSHSRVNGYAKFQKDSYNHFMTTQLPHIISEFSNPAVVHESVSNGHRHVISLGKVTMSKPSHRESDGKVCMLLPEEARQRQLDYTLLVMVDVIHEIFPLEDTTTDAAAPAPTAQWTMHLPEMKRFVHREVPFFEMPVMVQSQFCSLHGKSRVPMKWDGSGMRHPSAECPRDEGGYFIVHGVDRSMEMRESLRINTAFVFAHKQNKYGFMCEVRSRHESKLRSTSTLQVNITARKGGASPVIVVIVPFLYTDVPLLALFRMLGLRDTMYELIAGPDQLSELTKAQIQSMMEHSCGEYELDDVFEMVARSGLKEVTQSGRKQYLKHLLQNEFLPHLGLTNSPLEVLKKGMYMGMIVRRLLAVYNNAPPGFRGGDIESLSVEGVDDRDHYANKRLATSGPMIALLLRQHMLKFVRTLKRSFVNQVENRQPLNAAKAVETHKITADLRYAFRTGNWSAQRNSKNTQNVGVTQTVNRMSHLALKSQIGRVNTPMNREGRATHPRQAHLSIWGILCPNETPEGVSCGLVKNLSVLTHVRVETSSAHVEYALVNFMGVKKLSVEGEGGVADPWVIVNGDIVGTHPDPDALVKVARQCRRRQVLPYDATIVRCRDGVSVFTDSGCCMRPLFVVKALGQRLARVLESVERVPGEELWTRLVQEGIIEYIDKEEEMSARVAVTPEELRLEEGEQHQPYTHLEISPSAMLGHCARQIPFADRNQAPRNIYQASMGKQAVAVPTLPFKERFDAQMHTPHYTQRPLVQTGAEDAEFGMGINAIVAIMAHTGFNQEDSVIMNKAFVERGGFRTTYYTTHTAEEKSTRPDSECFENPVTCTGNVTGLKQANYDALDDVGTIELNASLQHGTVLIGKTVTTSRGDDKSRSVKRDNSVVYQGMDKDARVDCVMLTNNRDGVNCQRVRTRATRIPTVGDKFSSRHGQKGTVGVLLPQQDMPFSAQTGMTPDIIINPCALPSRMTIAHLVECVAAKTGVLLGKFVNGEPFRKMSVERDLCDTLHAAGFQRHGNERMMSGVTGEMLEAEVFMGPTYYQRLKHMTVDKVHSRSTGPRTTVTRQPTEGRSNHGGLRLGEMERDCLVSYGVSRTLMERYLYASDAYNAPMCKDCGIVAEHAYSTKHGPTVKGVVASCRLCGGKNVAEVTMPYAYKLLTQELYAMGVSVSHQFSDM